jgi:lipopolysaccharide assembly outer membrane protein LptD (OstA)
VLIVSCYPLLAQTATENKEQVDSTPPTSNNSSAIKSKVEYEASDSISVDVKNQKLYLYGNAVVHYESMILKAAYIEFNMVDNIAYSRGVIDSAGRIVLDSTGRQLGEPVFTDAQKDFNAKEITYNFETKKGKIREVTTKEGEAFIHASIAKKDTGDVYYIKNGKYTTCNNNLHPHFYLNVSKLKIIRDDKIIAGPSNLVVADVPTPLSLPFGVFPNKTGRKSGIIMPSYGQSELGYFLKDGGYYFGISDYFDLSLKGDIYSNLSYAVKSNTHYVKRYKYNGSFSFDVSSIKIGEKEFPDYQDKKGFFLRWSHVKSAQANPNLTFSANVNAGSSSYQIYNSNTANAYLSNILNSNVAIYRSWQGKPYSLTLSMAHAQNTTTRTVDLDLPEASFALGRLYPFKNAMLERKPNMFEKISISPVVYASNKISTIDTLLFREKTINQMKNGLKFTMPLSTSTNFGPFVIAPSAQLNGYGYFQTTKKYWNKDSLKVYRDTVPVFTHAYDYSASVSVNTRLYCFYSNKHGRTTTLRHVISPSTSYNIRPDFSKSDYGYYKYVQADTLGNNQLYSIFEQGIYGTPPSGKYGSIRFSVGNNLELKIKAKANDSASTDKKIILIENLTFSGEYNLAALHFPISNYSFFGVTKLFKVINLTLNGSIDPYAYDDSLKRRIERLMIRKEGKIGRLTSAVLSVGTSLQSLSRKNGSATKKKIIKNPMDEDAMNYIQMHPDYYVDFNAPWDLSVNYSASYLKPATRNTIIQTLSFNGTINVTDKWKVGFFSGFDIVNHDFTYTSFNVYRDLHCWEMRLDWIPFGFRKSYMLTIGVKSGMLQDLRLNRRREWYDYN